LASTPRRKEKVNYKNRDTFLGAGGGALVGDLIFPGLGTAAGLLLGGYGGQKHAEKRSRSDVARSREGDHGRRRRGNSDGWDEDSRTYKKGWAVR
jgi:uncharacterized protein YcfJ